MDNLQPGQMLGPYRLMQPIGQGGMATVYKAYQAAMDRYVALKVLPHQLADNPTFIGRFQQEARIIANLEHPHILPVEHNGRRNYPRPSRYLSLLSNQAGISTSTVNHAFVNY